MWVMRLIHSPTYFSIVLSRTLMRQSRRSRISLRNHWPPSSCSALSSWRPSRRCVMRWEIWTSSGMISLPSWGKGTWGTGRITSPRKRAESLTKYMLREWLGLVWILSSPWTDQKMATVFNCGLSWWRHQMETFSALLAICARNSLVTGEFPAQRPVTWSFGVFFDLRLNIRLSKQWGCWWFETPSRPLWRHCNVYWGINSSWAKLLLNFS